MWGIGFVAASPTRRPSLLQFGRDSALAPIETIRALPAGASVGLVAAALAIVTLISVGIDARTHVSAAAVGWLYLLVILPVTLCWGRAAGLATAGATLFLLLTFLTAPRGLPYTNNGLDLLRLTMSIGGLAIAVCSVGQVGRRGSDRTRGAVTVLPAEAVIELTLSGEIATWCHEAQRIFGYEQREIVGRPLTVLGTPVIVQDVAAQPARLLKSGSYGETTGLAKDGRDLDLTFAASAGVDATGVMTHVSLSLQDATVRKSIQRTLNASNEALIAAVERIPDGIVLLDRQGRLLVANQLAHALLHVPYTLTPGTSCDEMLTRRFKLYPRFVWTQVQHRPMSTFLAAENDQRSRSWLRIEISSLQLEGAVHAPRFLLQFRDVSWEMEAASNANPRADGANTSATLIDGASVTTSVNPTGVALAPNPEAVGLIGHRTPVGNGRVSAREAEILGLIAQSRSNQEIAQQLGISLNTVERHIANLYRKLGLRGRIDAALYVLQHGSDIHPTH